MFERWQRRRKLKKIDRHLEDAAQLARDLGFRRIAEECVEVQMRLTNANLAYIQDRLDQRVETP